MTTGMRGELAVAHALFYPAFKIVEDILPFLPVFFAFSGNSIYFFSVFVRTPDITGIGRHGPGLIWKPIEN
jgi:hypothetical protein